MIVADRAYMGPDFLELLPKVPVDDYTRTNSCTFEEGKILAGLAAHFGGPILELGAYLGASTRYLHKGLAARPGMSRIYSVDIRHQWDEDPDWPFRRRIVADSKEYDPPEWCKLGFIDGDHSFDGALADARSCKRAGCHVFVFHDTHPHHISKREDPRRASIEFFKYDPKDWVLHDVFSSQGFMIFTSEKDAFFNVRNSRKREPAGTSGT